MNFNIAKDTIQSVLAAREKAVLGVRWPVKEITIVPKILLTISLIF